MKLDIQKIKGYVQKNKTLVISAAAALAALILITVLIVVLLGGEEPPVDTQTPGEGNNTPSTDVTADSTITILPSANGEYTVEKTDSKDAFAITVPNATVQFPLHKYVQTADGVTWTLSSDIEFTGSSTIISKTVQLEQGSNTYYILCTDDNGLFEMYTLSIYRRKMFTVSFENLTETQEVEEGKMAALPSTNPQKTGYTFGGWSFNFTTPIQENTAVKASWTANEYTITYDSNGGKAIAPQKVKFGSEVTLAKPTRDGGGYYFIGWKNQYEGTAVTDGVWSIAGDITLIAEWGRHKFTVTLNPAGGTLAQTTMEGYKDAEYQLPTPSRPGYAFMGWYLNDELYDSTGVWNRETDITLTAKWEEAVTGEISCTFISNGGSKVLPQTQTLPIGSALPVITRDGFTFGGWFMDDALTVPVTTITKELLAQGETLRLYAWWKEEAKPGAFIYELKGDVCLVTGYRTQTSPLPVIPAYIAGRRVEVDIKNPNAGITVSPQITLTVNDATQLYATYIPPYASSDKIIYFTTESDCIQLGADGSIVALKPGVAVVTVSNSDGSYTATCTITVLGIPNDNPGITVKDPEVTLEEGDQFAPDITFVPERQGDDTALTLSTDSDCVQIENGVIIAIKPGVAVISVQNVNGKYTAQITITVIERQPDPNAGITPTEDEITLEEGEQGKIEAAVTPAFPEDSTDLIFSTESDCIELSEDGSFTAVKEGVATVKITTAAGLEATVTVTVTAKAPVANPDAGIVPTEDEITLEEGEQGKIEATVTPAFPEDSTDLVFSTESDCIELGEDGSFTAVKEGVATVKITTAAGLEATVTITVTAKAAEPDPEPEPEPDPEPTEEQ